MAAYIANMMLAAIELMALARRESGRAAIEHAQEACHIMKQVMSHIDANKPGLFGISESPIVFVDKARALRDRAQLTLLRAEIGDCEAPIVGDLEQAFWDASPSEFES